MTIYALRTSDSKEWVGLDYYDGYTWGIGKTPYLFNEAHESYPVKATQDTGHPCEWVEVDLTVKGEQPVKAALPSLLLAGKLDHVLVVRQVLFSCGYYLKEPK